MNYSELHEDKKRGTFDFPIELYYVEPGAPRYQMPLHWHLEYELILVLQGSFTLSIDGRQTELQAGDSAWIADGVIHGGEPHDCIYECVVFDLGTLLQDTPVCTKSAAAFLASENGFSGRLAKGGNEAALADRIFDAMEREQLGYEWTTVGLLWQLLGCLLGMYSAEKPPQSRQQITRMKNVLTYIRNNYAETVTLEELAAVAGMSPRYFCRAFAAMTGKTPIAYLNYYRIECACERLTLTDKSVTEIAFACGFNDMNYFSRVFKRLKGTTPTAYRN